MASGGPLSPLTSPSNRQTLRLQRDLKALAEKPLPFVTNLELSVVDSLNQLNGILIGPENSDYAGGYFPFIIRFLPEFPFKPPDFFFSKHICHPNVDSRTGIACHDQLLATWEPKITLTEFLTEMHKLLAQPVYGTPLEGDSLLDKSPAKAREWTQLYAKSQ